MKGMDVDNDLNLENEDWWRYDQLPSGEPYDWDPANRGDHPCDAIDFHLDLGCGKLKKGRLGIDRYPSPEVDLLVDLDALAPSVDAPPENAVLQRTHALYARQEMVEGLPFPDNSIESIVTHHCLEHLFAGFLPLMDECHRVLVPGGVFRIIVPLFPSYAAISDPDHKRYFCVESFDMFCGSPDGGHWAESFSVPYTKCRFQKIHEDYTARNADPSTWWMPRDAREIRVALKKWGG